MESVFSLGGLISKGRHRTCTGLRANSFLAENSNAVGSGHRGRRPPLVGAPPFRRVRFAVAAPALRASLLHVPRVTFLHHSGHQLVSLSHPCRCRKQSHLSSLCRCSAGWVSLDFCFPQRVPHIADPWGCGRLAFGGHGRAFLAVSAAASSEL